MLNTSIRVLNKHAKNILVAVVGKTLGMESREITLKSKNFFFF